MSFPARFARWPNAALLSLLCVLFLVPAAFAAKQLYTCGMHPQIIRDAPGDCPICGMKLQPVRANSAATGATATGERKIKYYKSTMIAGQVSEKPGKDTMGMDMVPVFEDEKAQSAAIQIDAATVQRMNLKTALVTRGPVRREFRTVGTVAYNEEGFRDITTKYEGWIERLLVNTTWATVKAGDPLFEIYSPDLYNAELNYVTARRSEGAEGGPFSRAATARLQLLDLPVDEIATLERTGEVPRTRVFASPSDGVVIEKMGVTGQMMKPGEKIYRLADLSTVWIVAQVYESDLPFVREGQEVTVRTTYGVTRTFTGTVGRLLPQVEEQTRAVAARIVVSNADGYLRPGMFTDVQFSARLTDSAVLAPETAILRSGEKNTVFIAKDGGMFEPREVTLGTRSQGGNYEVLNGLAEGERIVTSGQFMLDSESQLREAIQKMLKGDAPPAAEPAVLPKAERKISHYKSSMAPGEISKTPGKDSMGMDLIPVYEDEAGSPAKPADAHAEHVMPVANAVHLFTCPMDEHADVVADKPGKCPKCGMKLVPTADSDHGKQSEELWHKQHPDGVSAIPPTPQAAQSVAALRLPPGHPPITGASVIEYLRLVASADAPPPAANEKACGSCGMSAAQMAAGEPCEHLQSDPAATTPVTKVPLSASRHGG